MTVRLSQLANIDWKSGVPNAKGELNNKNIDNLRYILENIDHTGASKPAILGKCWKYVSKLESPDEIIQATSLLIPRFLYNSPSPPKVAVKFKNDEHSSDAMAYGVQLLKKLAPNLKLSTLTSGQFNDILDLFNCPDPKLTAEKMLKLQAIAERAKFQVLKDKLDPLIENRLSELLESKTSLTVEQRSDLIDFLSSMGKRDQIFERAAKLILGDWRGIDKSKLEKLLKSFSPDERAAFVGYVEEYLKDKDDRNYFYTHKLMDDAGLYKHIELKEGIPLYAWNKLLSKSEFLKGRDKFKNEPIDANLLYILLRREFPESADFMPNPTIDKNNISEILHFLMDKDIDFSKTGKSIIKDHLAGIIDSLNAKKRGDLTIAVNIHNYLSRIQSSRYNEELQKLFNKELEERQNLSVWETVLSSLMTFFGLAIDEWIKVDKTFLLETLSETSFLDLKLSPSSYEELWPWISKRSLRSIDLSDIADIPEELIFELPLTLEHLNLSGNKLITDNVVEHLKKMDNLKSIKVSDTNLSAKAKVELAIINAKANGVVDLRGIDLTDDLIELIPTNTKRILFGNCLKITVNGFAPLLKMTDLEHVELGSFPGNNSFYLRDVLNLPKLTSIKLTGIQTNFENIAHILKDYKIQKLELDSCNFDSSQYKQNLYKSTIKVLELTNTNFYCSRSFFEELSVLKLNDSLFDKYTAHQMAFANKITVKSEKLRQKLLSEYGEFFSGFRITVK